MLGERLNRVRRMYGRAGLSGSLRLLVNGGPDPVIIEVAGDVEGPWSCWDGCRLDVDRHDVGDRGRCPRPGGQRGPGAHGVSRWLDSSMLTAAAVGTWPADHIVTAVRQRVIRERKGRRGHTIDPAWTNRRLLRAGNTLGLRAPARLRSTLEPTTPPTGSVPPGASRNSSARC